MDTYEQAVEKIDEIEEELRRLGRWQSEPLAAEKFDNMGAFGMNTMVPEQWLQFVLIPAVKQIIDGRKSFPGSSEVSVWATRNFDGDPDAGRLLTILREFDALFR